ncbi:MAG: hypothetical protein JW936_02835 [Sedimentisphaerales bacterium]|nr:hypothetical protein [Sedimentisphaerales bacterium]
MNSRERFQKLMAFEPVDRLPVLEWAPWWTDTIDRWRKEGLPAEAQTVEEIRDYFGQDKHRHIWFRPNTPEHDHGMGLIKNMDDYQKIKSTVFGDTSIDFRGNGIVSDAELEACAQAQANGEITWITLEGFFWYPRVLFGIEPHMYAFYDHPELMHQINSDLADYHKRILAKVRQYFQPDFMTFAEDMSYNLGPMLSKDAFDEFLKPYYQQVIPTLKEMGTTVIIDSDGLIDELIPWCLDAGAEGFLPLERQAGVDLNKLRQRHPQLRLIGGFDKMTMNKGEQAMRTEFERLLPVMAQGGYLLSVDHQTPPGVSFDDYKLYMKLQNEYARKATQ